MGCTGAKRGAAVAAPLSTGTLLPWDDDLDICIPAEKMPGKVRHVLSESELLRHIGLFRKKIPFFWYGDEKRTNTLRIETSLGLTYTRKMLGQFKGISHLSLTFDPVLHGGQEILAASSPYAPVPCQCPACRYQRCKASEAAAAARSQVFTRTGLSATLVFVWSHGGF